MSLLFHENNYSIIGKKLIDLRVILGCTNNKSFAKKLEIKLSVLEEWLSGNKTLEIDTLIKIYIKFNKYFSLFFPDKINHYGFNLRIKRVQAGLSGSSLAKVLKINQPTISKIENRKIKTNSKLENRIENYLDKLIK